MENDWEEMSHIGSPPATFGHTITLLGRTKAVLFGGAIDVNGSVVMTNLTYVFNVYKAEWCKIERIFYLFNSIGKSSMS